jgi:hypothetical protein
VRRDHHAYIPTPAARVNDVRNAVNDGPVTLTKSQSEFLRRCSAKDALTDTEAAQLAALERKVAA